MIIHHASAADPPKQTARAVIAQNASSISTHTYPMDETSTAPTTELEAPTCPARAVCFSCGGSGGVADVLTADYRPSTTLGSGYHR